MTNRHRDPGPRARIRRAAIACLCLSTLVPLWVEPAFAAAAAVQGVEIRRPTGEIVSQLAPGDTFFVDVLLSDADGFQDVTTCEMGLWYQSFGGYAAKPWRGVSYQWERASLPHFVPNTPASDWQLIESLSGTDTLTNSTQPQVIRYAVVLSTIARASAASDWMVQIWAPGGTNYKTWQWNMAERFDLATADTVARFAPGAPGALDLPLVEPPGSMTLTLVSNAQADLQARGGALAGVTDPLQNIPVGGPASNVSWERTVASVLYAGPLDSVFMALGPSVAPNVNLTPQILSVTTRVDLPPGSGAQAYRGPLEARMRSTAGFNSATETLPMVATVTSGGLAADSARAEVNPDSVVAGTPDQLFTVTLRPFASAGSTGVNWISTAIPTGYGTARISAVRLNGTPIAFFDHSVGGQARTRLGVTAGAVAVIDVDVHVAGPTLADSVGQDFPVAFDDTTTAIPAQGAMAGDANGLADADGWRIRVTPGPLAQLNVSPGAVATAIGNATAFAAETRDAFGNLVSALVTWRTEGGIGSVGPTGVFLASAAGSGWVIAESGVFADTALVTVAGVGIGVEIVDAVQQPGVLRPATDTVELFQFRIANQTAGVETLSVLHLADASVGPPGVAESDGSWGALELLQIAGGSSPVSLGLARMVGGVAVWDRIGLAIATGDTATMIVRGGASVRARDGDALDLALPSATAVEVLPPASVNGTFPVGPAGRFTVDGMAAAQVAFAPLPASPIRVGTTRQLALDVRLPGNGYDPDLLQRLNVTQRGTAVAGTDLSRMEAWEDDGDGVFDAGRDARLGELRFTGDRWELTGLARPVPAAGLRLFVTVDVADFATEARTIRLGLPSLPDVAFGMASGNDGPVDSEIVSPTGLVVSTADRVTFTALPIAPASTLPGSRDRLLLAVVATNTYAASRRVTSLTLTNASVGTGTQAELDREFDALTLRLDGDGDGVLGDLAQDPVLAAGAWGGGRASFTGLGWDLPAGASRTLFVTGVVSSAGAADGDRLTVTLKGPVDAGFDSSTALVGSWPLTSGPGWLVDGMAAAQLRVLAVPGVTLGPGEGPVPGLDLVAPRNGYRDDVLQGVSVANRGTAGAGDIAEIRLWRDGGDGVFGGAVPDDRDLGPMTQFAGLWRSPVLAEAVGAGGARLFLSITATASPADSSTVRLEIPTGGLLMSSGNSGPLDASVGNPDPQILSTAPLVSSLSIGPGASVGGQGLAVSMTVRNRSGERIMGITPSGLASSGLGTASLASGPAPASIDLDPGAQQTFAWGYVAGTAGDVRLAGLAAGTGAVSGTPRRSLVASSNLHQIFTQSDSLEVFAVQSMPSAVNRGQTGVVPLAITFVHPGSASSSGILVRGLSARLESGTGGAVIPAELFAGVAVLEGGNLYLSRTALEASGSTMDLTLATPAVVRPGEPVTLALRLDVSAATAVPAFRLVLDDSSSFAAEDATSGAPIRVRLQSQPYPVRTGLARIVSSAVKLDVSVPAQGARRASQGQASVRVGRVQLQNNGAAGITTDIRVASLEARLVLAGGLPVGDQRTWITRIRAATTSQIAADRPLTAADTAAIHLDLAPLVSVPAGLPVDLDLFADLSPTAPVGWYRIDLLDSTRIEARDPDTGDLIPARYAVTPLQGDSIAVERPADRLDAGGTPAFPAAAAIGSPGLHALTLALAHPGAPDVARIQVDTLTLQLLDDTRRLLAPDSRLSRIALVWNGTPLASFTILPSLPGSIRLPLSGALIAPGATDSLAVFVDLQATAPAGSIELVVPLNGIAASDVNLARPIAVAPALGQVFPLGSGVMRLEPPSRTLVADFASLLPPAIAPDGSVTQVARLTLQNPASGQQLISLDHLRMIAIRDDGSSLAIGRVCQRLDARVGGAPWAGSATLASDSLEATLNAAAPLALAGGASVVIALEMTPRAGVETGRFRLGLDAGGVGVIQPLSALLYVAVLPAAGRSFPMWTESAALAASDLAQSYASFPNPFAAGREPATFVYYMPGPGRVTLRIFTGRGEPVATVLDNVSVGAGLRELDRWDGRNGRGNVVANGFYVAQLDVRFDDGSQGQVFGKLAVLR